jgi:hypothetical protein
MAHWFKLGGLIVGASILSACMAGGTEYIEEEEEGATFAQGLIGDTRSLVNDASNTCVTRSGTADGAAVQLAACSGAPSQQWVVTKRAGGLYQIRAHGTDTCLTVPDTRAIQQRCDTTRTDQAFQVDASLTRTLISDVSQRRCLDSTQASVGSIQWATCQGTSTQRWTQQ